MKIDLSDKTILVTGANSGIGNAIAHELLDAGAQVALHFNSNSEGASKQTSIMLMKRSNSLKMFYLGEIH